MYCLHLFACSLRTFSVLLFKKESRNRTSFRLCPIPCNHFNLYVCSAVVSFSLISCPVLMWAEPWVCTWSPSPRSLYNVKWYSCVPLIGFSAIWVWYANVTNTIWSQFLELGVISNNGNQLEYLFWWINSIASLWIHCTAQHLRLAQWTEKRLKCILSTNILHWKKRQIVWSFNLLLFVKFWNYSANLIYYDSKSNQPRNACAVASASVKCFSFRTMNRGDRGESRSRCANFSTKQ